MVEEQQVELSELLKEVRRIEVQSNRLVSSVMAGGYSSVSCSRPRDAAT